MPDLIRTRAHLDRGLGKNLWTGFAVAVRAGKRRAEFAGGDVPDAASTVPWFSAGKPVAAVGVLRLLESHPDRAASPIAETLPELAGTHAGALTLRSILTHQTGLRLPETELRDDSERIWEKVRRLTPADCKLTPGQAAYDPAGGWWLLGQWIERVAAKPWRDYLENDLLGSAGIPGLKFQVASVPIRERRAGKWVVGEPGSGPGGGLTGPAADLACFYATLMEGALLRAASLQALVQPARLGKPDATFNHVVDFGFGVILNSNRHGADTVPYGFGTRAGPRAFGHGGARSSIAFADPDCGFTAAIFLNGRVPETEHQPRMRAILDLLRSELA